MIDNFPLRKFRSLMTLFRILPTVALLLGLLWPDAAFPKPVEPQAASKAANTFSVAQQERILKAEGQAPGEQGEALSLGAMQVLYDDDGTTPLAYIFDLKPSGFVVFSADTDINPLISYSFKWTMGTPLRF